MTLGTNTNMSFLHGSSITDLPVSNTGPLVKPSGTQNYTTGAIVDEQGQLILSVLVRLLDKSGKDLGAPTYTTTGYYDAWTDQPTDEVFLLFKAKGFKDQQLTFAKAIVEPDIIMSKAEPIPTWAILLVLAVVIAYSKKKGKNISGFETKDILNIALIVGGVIGFSVLIKILRSLGLGGDPSTNEQADPKSAFNPNYWQNFSTYSYAITESTARDYAKKIYNAFGVIQDDYNTIYGVFTQLKTKANVSFLAWVFFKQYGKALLSFLTDGDGVLPWDGLSYTHLQTILDYVKKLPSN